MNDAGHVAAAEKSYAIGFITALVSDELVSCEAMLHEKGWAECSRSAKYARAEIKVWSKNINGHDITAYSVAIGRMGQVASALETFTFLSRCLPTEVFLTGIAGSLKEDSVFKGDVVISTNAIWRTQNRIFDDAGVDKYRPYHHSPGGRGLSACLP